MKEQISFPNTFVPVQAGAGTGGLGGASAGLGALALQAMESSPYYRSRTDPCEVRGGRHSRIITHRAVVCMLMHYMTAGCGASTNIHCFHPDHLIGCV